MSFLIIIKGAEFEPLKIQNGAIPIIGNGSQQILLGLGAANSGIPALIHSMVNLTWYQALHQLRVQPMTRFGLIAQVNSKFFPWVTRDAQIGGILCLIRAMELV